MILSIGKMNFDNVNYLLFVTNCGIVFWLIWASMLTPFAHPFGIQFHVLGWSIWGIVFDVICWQMLIKRLPFLVLGIRQNIYVFEPVPQLMSLTVPWLTLAPFWFPFRSMLVVLVSFWMHFGSLWASFGKHFFMILDFRWYLRCRSIFLQKLPLPPRPRAEPCLWQQG